ncbi:TetR/AcrR family transcriptional regulator [Hyphococcus luteus]|uniref:TetR/AcrR family transcriptional regulator n=1 Tax=Hyphococcus luteus TaxID=2058213 RepID=A0A2S7K830_9PROT|nr:TetR/AcrR family transcriptional regulator [Marinicaulis flavus]PQA88643.1 TetR/AcrR family transcriptional regulator [Marinicaulis flavus]
MARLREFDIDEALDAMMGVFWREGFEGASMQDIEAETGLNKQSLYRVFPDKRAMYLAALVRYEEIAAAETEAVLTGEGTAQERFRRLFDGVLGLAAKGERSGCFLCNAAADQGQQDKETTERVAAAMRRIEKIFRAGLADAPRYKRDPKACEEKAASLIAVYFGLRVLTKANAPLRLLKEAAADAVAGI